MKQVRVPSQQFPPSHRLHYPWEYRRFFGLSKLREDQQDSLGQPKDQFRYKECLIFRIPSTRPHFRLGITIKAKGNSVQRNQVKRQVREAFRFLGPNLGAYDYHVVVPRSRKMEYPFGQQLRECLRGRFARALQ